MPGMSGLTNFNPSKDIPPLDGKVIMVTGGTAGLGNASIQAIAKHNPAHIYFTGRNAKAAQSLIDDVKKASPTASLTFLELDLSSLATIKPALAKFTHDRLDILMCNAGIMAKAPQLSTDGYEIQFATNHIGHAFIIKTLLPILVHTAEQPGGDVRIVCNTSEGWRGHPKSGIQFDRLRTVQKFPMLGQWIRYGQSKMANILYARELARRYPGITSVSIHPGVIATPLVSNLGFVDKMTVYLPTLAMGKLLTLDQGILNQLWVATTKKVDIVNGALYYPVGVLSNDQLDNVAKSEKLASELWKWTETAFEGF